MKQSKLEKRSEEERELVKTMRKNGTGDVSELFLQSFMSDRAVTQHGAAEGAIFSLLNISIGARKCLCDI
jgi:hypothetical protein